MPTQRKSFIIHKDSLSVLDELSDEQAGLLFKAIKAYQNDESIELDSLTKIVFSPFKAQFDRDDEKYNKIVERNKNNGLKGGRPKTEVNPKNPEKPSGLSGNPENPSKADSKSKSKSKSKSDSKSDSDNKNISTAKAGRFTPPTDIETVNYFCEKKSTPEEAEKFWYFYDAKNWMVGKNKMKNWKSAASGWIARNKGSNKDILAMSAASDWHKEEDQGF